VCTRTSAQALVIVSLANIYCLPWPVSADLFAALVAVDHLMHAPLMGRAGDRVGDDRAIWLANFVMPHEPAVRGWLRRGRHLPEDIDDIIQESYAKLVGVADVSQIGNVRAYFFRTAYSVVAGRLRRKSVVTLSALADAGALYEGIDQITPEDTLCGRNELQRLSEMIGRLPDKTRRIFVLSRVLELSQNEVSKRTGVPASTVEKHIAKAFRLLMAAYADGGYEALVASRVDRIEKNRQLNAHGNGDRTGD